MAVEFVEGGGKAGRLVVQVLDVLAADAVGADAMDGVDGVEDLLANGDRDVYLLFFLLSANANKKYFQTK